MESKVTVKPCFVRLVRLKTINAPSSQAKPKSKSTAAPRRIQPKKEIRCPVCNKLCKYNNELEIHLRVHTGERPFACTICKQRFKSQTQVSAHASMVQCDSRPFSCLWCDKSFKTNQHLIRHLRMHTKEKPHFCKKFPDSFSSSGGLTQHDFCKHNSGKGNNKCEYCNKMFYSTSLLQQHRRIHTGEKPYSCSRCGKSFTQKCSLVIHSRVHSENRPFKCKKCPKTFRFQTSLHRHCRNVHERRRPFPCELCGQTFSTKGGRDTHINYHLNEKPFQCPKCPKRFTQRNGMDYHVKAFHENRRDFRCSECPLAFVDKNGLDRHFLHRHAHPSERPYACLFCSKRYCRPDHLENHLRSHTLEKPDFCTLCPSSFALGGSLHNHLARVHQVNC